MKKDPVCLMDIDGDEAIAKGLVSEYQGQVIVFCSDQCKEEFDAHPEVYAGEGMGERNADDDSDYAY